MHIVSIKYIDNVISFIEYFAYGLIDSGSSFTLRNKSFL